MYIDTHCHLQDKKYKDINMDELIAKIVAAGVGLVIVSGYDEESNLEAIELAQKYKEVYATVGYHPEETNSQIADSNLDKLEKLVNANKVVAIGEIGLDYHYDGYNKELQQEMFVKQLQLANKYKKPVVIHSRDSASDTYNILSKYKDPKIKGVLHCYASSYEMALKFSELNMIFGISGVITYKNSVTLKEVVLKMDLKKLLLETDAPYLSPEPKRGQINDSSNIPYIAQKIAEIKGIEVNDVMSTTTLNARQLFDIQD